MLDTEAPPTRRRRSRGPLQRRRRGRGGGGTTGPSRRGGPGTRARRQRAIRRERLLRRGAVVLAALAGLAGVVWVVAVGPSLPAALGSWFGDDAKVVSDEGAADAAAATVAGRRTVLVATLDEPGGQRVTDVQLLALDEDGAAAIVLVPASVVTDVPGYGLIPLSDAGGLGGVPLLELTIENALDVPVDASVTMTPDAWAALFARSGGFEVTVPEAIDATGPDGAVTRVFEPGAQVLDGPGLATLLTVDVPGESELAALPRTQAVLEGFLAATSKDPAAVFADGAPMLETAAPGVVEEVVRTLAAARAEDRLDVVTLPVEPVGAGDDVVYQVAERGRALAVDVLGAGTADPGSAGAGVRLEVLNGNGRVGVGAEVAALLVPLGYVIPITGNADSFDVAETVVTVREDDPALLAAAREVVATLGVGRVAISGLPSTTVDITLVVGADWAPPAP